MSNNPQVRRTKKLLSDALIQLMKEKPFHKISIRDIVKEADLSRSAFYSHYSSKEAILYEKVQEIGEEAAEVSLVAEVKTQFLNWKRSIGVYLQHKEFFALLYKNGLTDLVYRAEIENYGKTEELVAKTLNGPPEDVELYYNVYIRYHRQAALNLIQKWIASDSPGSIDEIASLISSMSCIQVYNAFRDNYYRNLEKSNSPSIPDWILLN
ncbi:MAG: TetR/AcrR family transcriptional regulator [Clostridiales bacterium]|nr:TetR/AcrR family transcriptional regulator [Clostridiales bacterium]